MVASKNRIVAFLILASFGVSCFCLRNQIEAISRRTDLLRVDGLDLGTIWESEEVSAKIRVENLTDQGIDVVSIATSCNCASLDPDFLTIDPGPENHRHINLALDATAKEPNSEQLTVKLWPKIRGERQQLPVAELEWVVRAKIRPVLAIARQIALNQESEFISSAEPLAAIPFAELVPLHSLIARCDSSDFDVAVKRGGAGETGQVVVRRKAFSRVGPYRGKIGLIPILHGGEVLPTRTIAFEGIVASDMEATPPGLQLVGKKVGEVHSEFVTLRSRAGLEIGRIWVENDGQGLEIQPRNISPTSHEFSVQQQVGLPKTQDSRILFSVEYKDGRRTSLVYLVSCIGSGVDGGRRHVKDDR